MSTSPGSNVYSQGYGATSTANVPGNPIISTRDPTSSDIQGTYGAYALGQLWVNKSANTSWQMTSLAQVNSMLTATWVELSAGGGSGIRTIDGNVGSVTGTTVTLTTGNSNVQGTSIFTGSGATMTQTFSDGSSNTGLGLESLEDVSGTDNTAFGAYSLSGLTGNENCAFGSTSLFNSNSGSANCAYGFKSLEHVTSASQNTCIGHMSGSNYSGSESNNICIGYGVFGQPSESNAINIGNDSNATCNITGIYGNSPSSPQMVIVNSSGQMGSQAIPSSSAVSSGTWNPRLSFSGGSSGIMYDSIFATYVTIGTPGTGNAVTTATGTFSLGSKGVSVGNAQISGLPYVAFATTTLGIISLIQDVDLSTGYGSAAIQVSSGSSILNLIQEPVGMSGSVAFIDNTLFSDSSIISFTITYQC